jgi:hypothetical protein
MATLHFDISEIKLEHGSDIFKLPISGLIEIDADKADKIAKGLDEALKTVAAKATLSNEELDTLHKVIGNLQSNENAALFGKLSDDTKKLVEATSELKNGFTTAAVTASGATTAGVDATKVADIKKAIIKDSRGLNLLTNEERLALVASKEVNLTRTLTLSASVSKLNTEFEAALKNGTFAEKTIHDALVGHGPEVLDHLDKKTIAGLSTGTVSIENGVTRHVKGVDVAKIGKEVTAEIEAFKGTVRGHVENILKFTKDKKPKLAELEQKQLKNLLNGEKAPFKHHADAILKTSEEELSKISEMKSIIGDVSKAAAKSPIGSASSEAAKGRGFVKTLFFKGEEALSALPHDASTLKKLSVPKLGVGAAGVVLAGYLAGVGGRGRDQGSYTSRVDASKDNAQAAGLSA